MIQQLIDSVKNIYIVGEYKLNYFCRYIDLVLVKREFKNDKSHIRIRIQLCIILLKKDMQVVYTKYDLSG